MKKKSMMNGLLVFGAIAAASYVLYKVYQRKRAAEGNPSGQFFTVPIPQIGPQKKNKAAARILS